MAKQFTYQTKLLQEVASYNHMGINMAYHYEIQENSGKQSVKMYFYGRFS